MNESKRKGQGLVEFALILPILILLLLGIAEGAHIIQAYIGAQSAARAAARYAVSGQPLNAAGDPWTKTPQERLPFIKTVAISESLGVGYTRVVTQLADYNECLNSTNLTCAGTLGVRVDAVQYSSSGSINNSATVEDYPGTEGNDVRVSLYHNVVIWDPIYEAIVRGVSGAPYFSIRAEIVMRNEGGPPITGNAPAPEEDTGTDPNTGGNGTSSSPVIEIVEGDVQPVGEIVHVRIRFHDPNTPYNIYIGGELIPNSPVTTDAQGNGIITYQIPYDKAPGTYLVESRTLAGATVADTELILIASIRPIILTNGDIWPLGSVLTYSLASHPASNNFEILMSRGGANNFLSSSHSTNADGDSVSQGQYVIANNGSILPGEWLLQSRIAPTIYASRTILLTQGCIMLNQGTCAQSITTPRGVFLNILLTQHAHNRNYKVVLVTNNITETVIYPTVTTDDQGTEFLSYYLPLDMVNGNYAIRTYDLNPLSQKIAETPFVVNTPTNAFIAVQGGYKWPAGNSIEFQLRNHTPGIRYDIFWEGAKIIDNADPTNIDGMLALKYRIPITMPQAFTYTLQSRPHTVPSGSYTALSPDIEVIPQPYLWITEGSPQVPGATVTVELHNHNLNTRYRVYVDEPSMASPGRELANSPITTDNTGYKTIKYTIPANEPTGGVITITSYLRNEAPLTVTAQTTLSLLAADLRVLSIETPPNPVFNQDVPVTVTVINAAPVTITQQSFDVDVYLDPADTPNLNRSLPPGDIKVWIQPPLAYSQTRTFTAMLPIYGAYDHTIWARADTSNRIPEGSANCLTNPASLECNNLNSVAVSPYSCAYEYNAGALTSTNIVGFGSTNLSPADLTPSLRLVSAGESNQQANDETTSSGYTLAYREMGSVSSYTCGVASGWASPSANGADTGGDGNGFESNPTRAYASDNSYAQSNNNGNINNNTNYNNPDRHRYYNYGFDALIPSDATIQGVQVRLDWRLDGNGGTNTMSVELSADGGTTWTSPYATTTEPTSEQTTYLGGAADTWGRTWTPADFYNNNFRVRVSTASTDYLRDFSLDWIPVQVTYCQPSNPSPDFEVQTRITTQDTNANEYGIEIRDTMDRTAAKLSWGYYRSWGDLRSTYRATNGTITASADGAYPVTNPRTAPLWLRVVKSGNSFTLYSAADDHGAHGTWTQRGSALTVAMSGSVMVGVYNAPMDASNLRTADFQYYKICNAGSDCSAGNVQYEPTLDGTVDGGWDTYFFGQEGGEPTPTFSEYVPSTYEPFTVDAGSGLITISNNGEIATDQNNDNDTGSGYLFGYQQISGNFDVRVRALSQSPTATSGNATFGLEIRNSLDSTADKLMLGISNAGTLRYWYRISGVGTNVTPAGVTWAGFGTSPIWLRIAKTGNSFTMYYSTSTDDPPASNSWVQLTSPSLTLSGMGDSIYLGLNNTPYNATTRNTVTFNGYHICAAPSGAENCGEVRESAGLVVIDANNTINTPTTWRASSRSDKIGYWIENTYSPDSYSSPSGAPELRYGVNISTVGTYYVWILGYSASDNDDSLFVGPTASPPSVYMTQGPSGILGWFNTLSSGGAATVNFSDLGSNSLSVWMREDGFEIYQILLTTDAGFTPNINTDYQSSQCSIAGAPEIPPGTKSCESVVTNGDFEDDDQMSLWQYQGVAQQVTRTSLPHYFAVGQSFSMMLPATNIAGTPRRPWLYQEVQMPGWVLTPTVNSDNGTSLNLKLHVAVNPEEQANPDLFQVVLKNVAGADISQPITITTGDSAPYIDPQNPDPENSQWVLKTMALDDTFSPLENLLNYSDQTVRLYFYSPNPAGTYSTRFYVDNVSLNVCTMQPIPTEFSTKVAGKVYVWQNSKFEEMPGVFVWIYAVDGKMDKTYTIQDSTFSFYNLPAASGGTNYIVYAEYWEDDVPHIASTVISLSPGQRIEDLMLLLF